MRTINRIGQGCGQFGFNSALPIARNPFRHPTPEALARLEAAGARIYRTDRDGAIVIETDGMRLWITRWARGTTEVFDLDPERSSEAGEATFPRNVRRVDLG